MKRATQQQGLSSESEANHGTFLEELNALLLEKLEKGTRFEGIPPVPAALIFALRYEERGGPLLWLTQTNREAEDTAENLRFFLSNDSKSQVLVVPGNEADPYRGLSPHPSVSARRAAALWKLARGFRGIIVTSMTGLLSRTVAREVFLDRSIFLQINGAIGREDLILKLRSMGYTREDPVSEPGEFSFRGGIVDVFSASRGYPVRIEFFGDEIESLREFDPSSQRSTSFLTSCEIDPMREFIISDSEIEQWHREAPEFWNEVRYAAELQEIRQFTENKELFNGFEYLFPLVLDLNYSLFDLLHDEPTVILSEPATQLEELRNRWETFERSYEEADKEGSLVLPAGEIFFGEEWLKEQRERYHTFEIQEFSQERGDLARFDFRPEKQYQGRIQELFSDLSRWSKDGEHVTFAISSEGMADRLVEIFREYEIFLSKTDGGFVEALEQERTVVTGRISRGFHSPSLKLHVLTQDEVFGETRVKRGAKAARSEGLGKFLSDFRDLHEGDYVVHLDHGIGVFVGMKHIGVEAATSEFVVIEYSGGSKLYVPVDRLDLLQKYSSGDTAAPQVDRLGGASWKKTKNRIKKSMRVLAEDLLKLYAKREVAEGHAFATDDELMGEFEKSFEFEETPDQAAAITATKKDMESTRPMDRLICGDVGYGKTEVAMRAAFKAVSDGKQVAVLAPTTVLAFQHFNTFSERLKGFPVKVGMLSRFLSKQEQREEIQKAVLGMVDILVGTHRILSKDVRFQDLGLIIVDEEQRFGVAQKEKLKKLKAQVDVLTLSATPIPRTLNMSLVGIRDLSIIETAPKDRLAIQTAVVKFSRKVIRSAIDLELKRNGQVFFVHNSVETIYSMAQTIQETIPEARVAVAHGQMKESMLEEVMLDFLSYRYDVLVCTTIIENGLDIPRSNTIIINKADRFGLSQLYQLRGRVGRSDRRAYAYLLISGEDVLTTDAKKRLAAIREFSDLGSGFRLAALDLEIRGAGNLLGGEQSGHIAAVGFELYVKLLEQAVREVRGEEITEELKTTVDLRMDVRIPEHYVDDSSTRLWLYKRISAAADQEGLERLCEEIQDRFGRYPRSVTNLFKYARIRSRAQELKVISVERKGDRAVFKFREDTPLSPEQVIQMVSQEGHLRFNPDGSLSVLLNGQDDSQIFARIEKTLDRLMGDSQ